jgi:hypothetical protein
MSLKTKEVEKEVILKKYGVKPEEQFSINQPCSKKEKK